MAENPLNPRDAKKVNEELGFVEDALLSIAATLTNTIQEAIEDIKDSSKGVAEVLKDQVGKNVKNLARDLNKTAENTEKIAKGTLKRADIDKQITARLLKQQAITRNLATLANAGVISKQEEERVVKEINEAERAHSALLKDQLNIAIQTQKNMGITGRLIKGISKIPILGDLIDAGDVLAKTTAAAAEEGATKFSTAKAGGKALLNSAKSLGPAAGLGIAVTLFKKFVELSFKADTQVTSLSRNLSLSKDAARGLYTNLNLSKSEINSIYNDTENLVKAMTDLSSRTSFISMATNDQLETQILLTKELGLSKEEANELQNIFAVNSENAIEGKNAIVDQVAAFANQNKVIGNIAQISKEIATTSALTRLSFKGNSAELAKAVINANRLGLSLSQVESIGNSLLDFESSIVNEMQAEIFLNKDLNLEKARSFALDRDMAGLTAEIKENVGDAAEFADLNVFAQNALAKTFGMQAGELADILYQEELIADVAGDYLKNTRAQADALREQGKIEEANNLEKTAALVRAGVLTGKNLTDAQTAVSAQDKFNQLILKLQELFTNLFKGEGVDNFVKNLETFFKFFASGGSIGDLIFGDNKLFGTKSMETQGFGLKPLQDTSAEDFTIQTHPKDTLVLAGGTKLGEGANSNSEVVSLLKELVNRNGDVYLDGQKVGNVLSSNYRTMSN